MSQAPDTEPKYDSLFRLFTERLYWFAIGPMLLILLLLGVINDEPHRRLYYSLGYLVVLAGHPISRWLDLRGGQALTANGKPATWTDFRQYAIQALAIGISALLVVHGALFWFATK